MIDSIVRKVTDSYLETALWAEHNYDSEEDDSVSEHFDGDYCVSDFTDEARSKAEADCAELLNLLDDVHITEDETLLDRADSLQSYERIGHDFWLTRNGHGAGFWDGDYHDRNDDVDYGDAITDIVKANFSECHIWADDDGGVYLD